MSWFAKILFWTWFGHQTFGLAAEKFSASQSLMLIIAVVIVFVVIRCGIFTRVIEFDEWPRFLKVGLRFSFAGIELAILGEAANRLVRMNNPAMPELPDFWIAKREVYFSFLSDYIPVQSSRIFQFLFPAGKISPGDLAQVAGIIFAWWAVIAISFWMLVYLVRRFWKI